MSSVPASIRETYYSVNVNPVRSSSGTPHLLPTNTSTMTSPHLLATSPSGRPQSAGLHINPSKGRPSSTSELVKPARHLSGRFSVDPYVVTTTQFKEEIIGDESSPLISRPSSRKTHGHDDNDQRSLSISLTILEGAKKKGAYFWLNGAKIVSLFGITLLCCVVLVGNQESEEHAQIFLARNTTQEMYSAAYDENHPIMRLTIRGPFMSLDNINMSDPSLVNNTLTVRLQSSPLNDTGWQLGVNKTAVDVHDIAEFQNKFRCPGRTDTRALGCNLDVQLTGDNDIALVYTVHKLSAVVDNDTVYAALILVFVYILIIFELVHRTVAAMLGALAALAVLSAINERPPTTTVISWMEMETLMLLFGMMIIVAVLSDTGVFDYSALQAYKLSKGKVWPLVTLLCLFSASMSAFLDNVTTILLIAPVTIRLCEVLNLEPRVILIAEVLFSNIGGTATAIGDPPNVIIVSQLGSEGITFAVFTSHLAIGVLFITIMAYGFLRIYYRNMQQLSNPDPPQVVELNHEIEMWRRTASRLVVVTREETLMRALFLQKAVELENFLNKTLHRKRKAERRDLKEQLQQLEKEYRIKDMGLLIKCTCVLLSVITFFFMYSFVSSIHIGLGWISVLGAIWLLVIADISDMESILHKVEWSTLLFFAALFILMEALVELGLMSWIGEQMKAMIIRVDEDNRLTAALIIIVWISALASSFIDNIPFTTAMIPVLRQLSGDPEVNLQLLPLVMALAFGACLGGNGTLIGASANVVCAGIAEQHGYNFSFKQFFKVGFPMMLVTTFAASIYLLICHSAIGWNDI